VVYTCYDLHPSAEYVRIVILLRTRYTCTRYNGLDKYLSIVVLLININIVLCLTDFCVYRRMPPTTVLLCGSWSSILFLPPDDDGTAARHIINNRTEFFSRWFKKFRVQNVQRAITI